jgi:hypothetical protein
VEAELFTPVRTSQYVPAGSDVVKMEDQAPSALLMATYPKFPRPKAIWFCWGDTQFVLSPDTWFLNRVMLAT